MHSQGAFDMPETVQSVVRCQENGPLIAAAAQLWIRPGDLVLDVTYGRGGFWTKCKPEHLVAHDLALDGVDFRQLPEADASVDVVVFDPPPFDRSAMATCQNCHSASIRPTKTLCSACYEYGRRTGRARPEDVVVKHNVRRFEQQASR